MYKTSSKPVPHVTPRSSAEVGKGNSGVPMKSMKLRVDRFVSDPSSRNDWMFSRCQKLFLLGSCHLTCFHSSDGIMVQQFRLGDYGSDTDLSMGIIFTLQTHSIPIKSGKGTDFCAFPLWAIRPSMFYFKTWARRHSEKNTRLEIFFQSSSRNWAETAIFITSAVSSSVLIKHVLFCSGMGTD